MTVARLARSRAKAVVMDPRFHALVAHPLICPVAAPVLRPLARWLPRKMLFGMPVRRSFRVAVPGSRRGFRAEVNAEDQIAKALFWYGLAGYEQHAVQLLAGLADHTGTFLDVGANTGVYSLLMAASNPGTTVHAFEPVPSVFARLRANVELNGFDNVHVHEVAVSDVSGQADIHVPGEGVPTESSLLPGFRPGTDTVPVRVTTLDDFVSENGIERVDVVKIDTEGTARMVIAGARRMLARDAPLLMCEILHAVDSDTAAAPLLKDLGYRPFLLTEAGLVPDDEVLGDPAYRDMNYVFVHRDRVEDLLAVSAGS